MASALLAQSRKSAVVALDVLTSFLLAADILNEMIKSIRKVCLHPLLCLLSPTHQKHRLDVLDIRVAASAAFKASCVHVGWTHGPHRRLCGFHKRLQCGKPLRLASPVMTLRIRIERMFRPIRCFDGLMNNAHPSGREVLWRRQSYSRAVRTMAVSTGPPSWT